MFQYKQQVGSLGVAIDEARAGLLTKKTNIAISEDSDTFRVDSCQNVPSVSTKL